MLSTPRRWGGLVLFFVAVVPSAAIGYTSWDGHAGLYAVALLPLLWWSLPTRRSLTASVFAYYVASMLTVATSILGYYPDWPAIAGWAMLCAIAGVNTAPWVLGWAPRDAARWRRVAGLVGALAIGILPPLGVIAWVHPLLSAGWIYPGGAWLALAATMLLWLAVAWRPSSSAHAMSLLVGAAVSVATGANYETPMPPKGLVAVNTQLTPAADFVAFAQKLADVDRAIHSASRHPGQVAVLPETTIDEFKASTATMIGFALGEHLYAGPILSGTTFHADNKKWSGAVMLRDNADPQFFRARQPLLFSLWHPWQEEDHYSADWRAPNVFDLDGDRVALRVCSEDFALFWTLLDFATDRPTVLVSMSNHWWTADPKVARIQAQHLGAAARLFGVPVVRASNSAKAAPAR